MVYTRSNGPANDAPSLLNQQMLILKKRKQRPTVGSSHGQVQIAKRTLTKHPVDATTTKAQGESSAWDEALAKLSLTWNPSKPIGRDIEINQIYSLVSRALQEGRGESLYLSGNPGTGKTLCVDYTLNNELRGLNFDLIQINCGPFQNPSDIFSHIAKELSVPIKGTLNSRNAIKAIQSRLSESNSKKGIVLVLDEADYLSVRDETVLYTLMELPHLINSKLILISIANTIDFPDRMLPWLRASQSVPRMMIFEPYNETTIRNIIMNRLEAAAKLAPNASLVLDDKAIQLCSRKIASSTGDIRSALSVCAEAVAARAPANIPSVKHDSTHQNQENTERVKVLPPAIAVVSKIFQKHGQSDGHTQTIQSLQLHAQLALCVCTIQLSQRNKHKEVTFMKMFNDYKALCDEQKLQRLSQQELTVVCENLADTGLIILELDKKTRQKKIRLNVTKDNVKAALCDRRYFQQIWNDATSN